MLKDLMRRVLVPQVAGAARMEPGLHAFEREHDGALARYHLRVEHDGSGLLLANAASACRLSPSGVVIAAGLLAGEGPEAVAGRVKAQFHGVSRAQAGEDVARVGKVLEELAAPNGRWPLSNLDEDSANRRTLSAPLTAELSVGSTETATAILRALWAAGVPQVVLVVDPGTPIADLPRLVEHAEDLGLITGVRARGSDLADRGLLEALAEAGLDRLDCFWAGPEARTHEELFGPGDLAQATACLEAARALEICPVAMVPVTGRTLGRLESLGAALPSLGVQAAMFYALVAPEGGVPGALAPEALPQAAAEAEETAEAFGLNLIWAPPTALHGADLAAAALAGPRAAGEGSVRVRADGSVLPPTGPARSAGNLLDDPWARIWSHEAFRAWREATDDPQRCQQCPGLAVCAGGCPRDRAGWAHEGGGA